MAGRVILRNRIVQLLSGENVLAGLMRSGVPLMCWCKEGSCQTCMLRARGPVPNPSQKGLTSGMVQRGYFLACVCVPEGDLQVFLPGEAMD